MSSNASSHGDDAESWTILDEDPDDLNSEMPEPPVSLLQGAAKVERLESNDDSGKTLFLPDKFVDDLTFKFDKVTNLNFESSLLSFSYILRPH